MNLYKCISSCFWSSTLCCVILIPLAFIYSFSYVCLLAQYMYLYILYNINDYVVCSPKNKQTDVLLFSLCCYSRPFFFKIKVEAVCRKNRWSLLYSYSTVYKLCALVDIQKTLMFLCCVPYHQLSGSHAITIALRLRTKLLKQVK